MLAGGCFCGRIRYEAAGEPFDQTLCHCSICRRTTGAPAVAWFTVRPADFRFISGDPRTFQSTSKGVRCFCGDCGAQLTFRAPGLDEVDVTIASLDDPDAVPPLDQIWSGDRVRWMDGLGRLPRYPKRHGDGLE